jgi:hypothetical protein
MNKLKEKEETPEERHGPGDYYEVVSQYGSWYVSPETAARVGRMLDRRWRPRWLKFVDLHGARTWVRTDAIEYVCESTETHRTNDRKFHYLRRKEHRADRRWDMDEE